MLTKLLIGFALTLVLAGGMLEFRSGDDQDEASLLAENGVVPAESSTNEDRSRAFEEWVISHFSTEHRTRNQWRTDTSRSSDAHPDRMITMQIGSKEYAYAIECKWRNTLMGISTDLTHDQIKRYQRFALDHQVPIFLILGVGGRSNAPEALYVIPLEQLKPAQLQASSLERFKQPMRGNIFHYNPFGRVLSY